MFKLSCVTFDKALPALLTRYHGCAHIFHYMVIIFRLYFADRVLTKMIYIEINTWDQHVTLLYVNDNGDAIGLVKILYFW